MLRVFRMKHIMRRHLEGAVTEAAGKLVFSLLSVLFIAAGLFYELEKYGVRDRSRQHASIKVVGSGVMRVRGAWQCWHIYACRHHLWAASSHMCALARWCD